MCVYISVLNGFVMFYLVDQSRDNGKTAVNGVVKKSSFFKRYIKYIHKNSGFSADILTESKFYLSNILKVQI